MPYRKIKKVCPSCKKQKEIPADSIFCSKKCYKDSVAVTPKTLDQADTEAHLRSQIRQLNGDLSKIREVRGLVKEAAASVAAAVVAAEPIKKLDIQKSKGQETMAAVLKLSDWHIGEVISAAETDGFGEFNWAIAQYRVQNMVNGFIKWVKVHRTALNIPNLHIFAEGDWVSGDIHYELKVTNEFPLPVQTAHSGRLLGRVIELLAPHFDEVIVEEVAGDNHGRMQPKPQFKQRGDNNMGYLVYAIANAYVQKLGNVEVRQHQSIAQVVDVVGQKFLLSHGDTIRGWMGIPYYGMERSRGREAVKRMQTDQGFDYLSCGHWHVPAIIAGNILVNGSLSGTSEFDHGCGRHAEPSQVSFLVHPKHGYYDWVPWKV